MRQERKTKIIATVGPATRDPDMIAALIQSGVNVFRLNFSHGTHEAHLEVLRTIHRLSHELDIPTAVLQDLAGPKIRITDVEGDYETIADQKTIVLCPVPKSAKGDKDLPNSNGEQIFVQTIDPTKVLQPGHRALLADGIIELTAEAIESDRVVCRITKGGRIRSRVGIAFPDSAVDLPAATEEDFEDLAWGVQNGVDYVAISFVQNANDIKQVRNFVKKAGGDQRIIAKIERKSALENIHEIVDECDGLMVARGDLGLELPLEQLPMIQKHLIEEANFRGIPVIVATQMLHSMITSLRPTRAEVSDIASTVMSGADAVMLSEETAIGENPIAAVEYLGRIAHEAEQSFMFSEYELGLRDADIATLPDAIAYAAAAAATKVNAAAVIACTETGTSARLIAKYRPQQPIFGTSSSRIAVARMCLYWGVTPVGFDPPTSHETELDAALRAVQKKGKFKNGSWAVITGGIAVRTPGSTSVMEIREMTFL